VLRKGLAAASPVALRLDDETVALNPAAVEVDVPVFERRVAEGTPDAFAEAGALYRGDLLAGLALNEAPFEEWLLGERERLRSSRSRRSRSCWPTSAARLHRPPPSRLPCVSSPSIPYRRPPTAP